MWLVRPCAGVSTVLAFWPIAANVSCVPTGSFGPANAASRFCRCLRRSRSNWPASFYNHKTSLMNLFNVHSYSSEVLNALLRSQLFRTYNMYYVLYVSGRDVQNGFFKFCLVSDRFWEKLRVWFGFSSDLKKPSVRFSFLCRLVVKYKKNV